MKTKKQINKILCFILILSMGSRIYSSNINEPIVLTPTNKQYMEVRAKRVKEIGEENYQVIAQLWVHGLETTGFSIRLDTQNEQLKPSNFESNEYTTNIEEYFKFENELQPHITMLSIPEDENAVLLIGSVNPDVETENQYIVEKEGVGKLLDSTQDTNGVLIGTLSFRSKTRELGENAIRIKTSQTLVPQTGINIMANKYDYYEDERTFKFTQELLSTNAKLSNLTTNLKEITDFNRDIYEYTIQISAIEKEITILPTPEEETATVTINGEEVDIQNGKVVKLNDITAISSKNVIEILVTAEDGQTTQKYKLNVEQLGGFLEGTVKTANNLGTHNATIKVYESSKYIDWKNTSSIDLSEEDLIAKVDTNDVGAFHMILPIGKFDILIDKLGYLDYVIKGVEITQRHTTTMEEKQIIPGDINKDGKVNTYDKSYFLDGLNTAEGSEKYSIAYDYLEDGKVNTYDRTIFLGNFNRTKIIEEN